MIDGVATEMQGSSSCAKIPYFAQDRINLVAPPRCRGNDLPSEPHHLVCDSLRDGRPRRGARRRTRFVSGLLRATFLSRLRFGSAVNGGGDGQRPTSFGLWRKPLHLARWQSGLRNGMRSAPVCCSHGDAS